MLGVAHDADEDVFGGQVGVKDHGDHQTRQGEAVGDFLHQSTGATESRAGNVASAVVVDDDADDEVSADGDTAAKVEGADVVSGVPHLRGDGEVGGHTGEGEDEGADGRHGLVEGRVADKLPVGLELSGLGSSGGAVLDTSGDGHGEDGSENAEHADPGEPTDLAQGSDGCEGQSDDSCDRDEDGSAGAVGGDCVKTDRHTKHSRASDEDPEETESNSKDVTTDGTPHQHANVGNAVDLRVVQLELANDVGTPGGDATDCEEDDDTGDHAKDVESSRDRKHTETDLSLHHEDGGSKPANAEVVGTTFFVDVTENGILNIAVCARRNADELLVEVVFS